MNAVKLAAVKIFVAAVLLALLGWLAFGQINNFLFLKQDRQVADDIYLLASELSGQPLSQWQQTIEQYIPNKACKVFLTPQNEPEGVVTHESLTYWQQQLPPNLQAYLHPIDNWACDQIDYDSWYLIDSIPNTSWDLGLVVKTHSVWPSMVVLAIVEFVIFFAVIRWALYPLKRKFFHIERLLTPLMGDDTKPEKTIAKLINEVKSLRQEKQLNQQEWRDLLHGVAHELRSPVARISFALSEWKEVDSAQERLELEGSIDRAMDELDKLVHEVLRYSRLELTGQTLNIEACELPELLSDCCSRVQPLYPGIEIKLKGTRPFIVNGDDQQLERAMINLLRNAARYAKQSIQVQWQKSSSGWTISIDDDGTGVPPGKRQRIFEPFTRLDPSRSRDSGGSGLGLAIVKTIVDNHHGTITVEDSAMGGASFTLTFPDLLDADS